MSVSVSLNALCAWWLLAAVWLVIRGVLRRADAAGEDQPASIVPRHAGEPQRQAYTAAASSDASSSRLSR